MQSKLKHQEFSTDIIQRKRIVRQDRYFPNITKHVIKSKNNDFEIDNYSSFGIAIRLNNIKFK